MLVGLIPQIDSFKDSNDIKLSHIQEMSQSNSVIIEKESNQAFIQKSDILNTSSTSVNNVTEANSENYYEVALANLTFGYNEKTNDLFVKIQKGETEVQYPSEEVLKLREYLQDEVDKINEEKLELKEVS